MNCACDTVAPTKHIAAAAGAGSLLAAFLNRGVVCVVAHDAVIAAAAAANAAAAALHQLYHGPLITSTNSFTLVKQNRRAAQARFNIDAFYAVCGARRVHRLCCVRTDLNRPAPSMLMPRDDESKVEAQRYLRITI
jgi:hypothetical protein